jgi:hypothetical protein
MISSDQDVVTARSALEDVVEIARNEQVAQEVLAKIDGDKVEVAAKKVFLFACPEAIPKRGTNLRGAFKDVIKVTTTRNHH